MTTLKTLVILLLLMMASTFCRNQQLSAQTADCNSPLSNLEMRSNNVNARIYNSGSLFFDPISFASGYEVPKGSGKHSMYSIGLWIGAKDLGGNLKLAASTYSVEGSDFWAGPIDETQAMGGLNTDVCNDYDQLFHVKSFDINKFRADLADAGGTLPASSIPTDVLRWPARNNPHFDSFTLPANKDLAPFWDADGDKIYDPTKGDYPVLDSNISDFYPTEMTWWIMNDIGNEHTFSGTEPLGVEVSCLAYSFASTTEAVNNTTFYKYKIRAAQNSFRDFYVGLYVDSDLGQYDDDYLGSIPELNTGFFYNADSFDGDYGNTPPLIGVRFLNGLTNEIGEDLGMTSLLYMELNEGIRGFPTQPIGFYRYLQGLWNDGTPLTKGGNGYGGTEATRFAYDGDPSNPTEWSECSVNSVPSDRRFVMSSGPVDLQVGKTQEINVAIYWTRPQNAYPCPSTGHLQLAIDAVESLSNTVDVPTVSLQNKSITAYPNPFSESISLQYTLPQASKVSAKIYNTAGMLVAHLAAEENQSAGQHQLQWDGRNRQGLSVPFGTYFCQLQIGNQVVTEKVVYLKE
ncbi:MAG: FlgD immunoglobulin-like domain containing protein [Chitinophagales bacterium]